MDSNEIIDVEIERLKVHPVNREIYVADPQRKTELQKSIEEHGILEPLIVMPDNGQCLILSGARRFDCARELGFETVPCVVIAVKNPVLAIIEHNRYRKKTPLEIWNEAQALKKVLEPKAKKQQGQRTDLSSNLTESYEPIDTRQIIAAKLNVSTGYLSMLQQVVENKDENPKVMQRLEAGRETVYSAYRRLKAKATEEIEIPRIFIGQYFAGKQRLVKDIIARMPSHECYVEPFGGFCSVLLNKPQSRVEVYNDISKDVFNLIRCLKENPLGLATELYLMPYSRYLYEQLIAVLNQPFNVPDVKRAANWYYVNESTFAALHGPPSPGSWSHGASRNFAGKLRNRFNRLLVISRRLLKVQIENRSWNYALERYDSPETFFYVDPPYYETDDALGLNFTSQQHKKLSDKLRKLQGKWLLTINDHTNVRELYDGFTAEKVLVQHSVPNAKDTGGLREYYSHLIITNYHSKGDV